MTHYKKILIINSAENNDQEFVDPINRIINVCKLPAYTVHWSELLGVNEMETYEGIIISGSTMGNNANFDERLEAFRWLKSYKNPVFGICAGHQFTSVIFGGKLINNKEAEQGKVTVKAWKNDPIFQGLPGEFEVKQQHLDSVSLPGEFELLASSDVCYNQAMKHSSFPLYSVQWHAEISNPEMILNFIRIIEMGL